jgi:DNA polymerase-3 subunit epsilon
MTDRSAVVVDVESSGLREGYDVAVEVGWLDMSTGESGCFVPVHDPEWVLNYGDPRALEINGYRERLIDAPQDGDERGFQELSRRLRGNTMCGSNPTFDWEMLRRRYGHRIRRHHRMIDLAAYAAGIMNTPITRLDGLEAICTRLGVYNNAPHTAMGDVVATGRCFEALAAMRMALEGNLRVTMDSRVPRGVAYVVPEGHRLPFGENR